MWAWSLFILYAIATAALALRASRGGETAASFAIGTGRMPWWMAGLTLGACLASSATFVVVPGFVYADGLAALVGFSLPLVAGLGVGLFLLSFRFQQVGTDTGALTIPHWLGARYESPALRRLFAALTLLQVAYLVLICIGCAYVMEAALGVPYPVAVVGIVGFVFAYTGLGGARAHAATNTLQAVVMLGVSALVVASGVALWPEVAADLAADHARSGFTAPGSPLFSTAAEVWLVPFFMGVALTTQPHLLSKALYVEGPAALVKTLGVALGTFVGFTSIIIAGAYARRVLPADVPQDQVMAHYIQEAFTWEPLAAVVSVAILAAAMSTLDGLLVAIAATVGNDLLPGRGSAAVNRLVLVVLAVITVAMAWSPPELALLLGQQGVYALVVASAGPLLAGLATRGRLDARWAMASALVALCTHGAVATQVTNPGVAACGALITGVPLAFGGLIRARMRGGRTVGADLGLSATASR